MNRAQREIRHIAQPAVTAHERKLRALQQYLADDFDGDRHPVGAELVAAIERTPGITQTRLVSIRHR